MSALVSCILTLPESGSQGPPPAPGLLSGTFQLFLPVPCVAAPTPGVLLPPSQSSCSLDDFNLPFYELFPDKQHIFSPFVYLLSFVPQSIHLLFQMVELCFIVLLLVAQNFPVLQQSLGFPSVKFTSRLHFLARAV